MARYFSLHTHSRYSAKDGMSDIKSMVSRAVELEYFALGLTDHGTPAGVVQHYTECRKAGIEPLPGVELYFTADSEARERRSMHLTVAAYNSVGYRNLTGLTTLAHQHFFNRPRVDVADLARLHAEGLTEGLLLATGCRSGPVVRALLEVGYESALRITKTLAGFFPKTYVEVMNHGFTADTVSDDELATTLSRIAKEAGLPVVVTGDSHYVLASEQGRHDAMKELLTFAEHPEDGRFSGCGYHLVDEEWLASFLEPAVLEEGLASLEDIANFAEVSIPELDTFTLKVPDVTFGADQDDELGGRVITALNEQFPGDEVAAARTMAELEVIREVGMAGYLLLVLYIVDRMIDTGVWFQARGSAAGSFVCYLLKITQVNPIEWGIRMDRFLSGDRTTPPDIDLDIQSDRRKEVIDWIRTRYAVYPVSVYSRYGLDADSEEQTGSLKVEYFSTQRKRGIIPAKEARIPADDWAMLTDLASMGLIKNTGTNAAGFIIAESEATLSILPRVRIGKGGDLVTAYDKDDVELTGFPKIDLLGLTMLYAMSIACGYAFDNPKSGWASIPDDDTSTMAYIAEGNTRGLFQLEGYAQRNGIMELNATKTADVVAAQALFRPGVSKEFLVTYMQRHHGLAEVPPMHPSITAELADTHGVAIYQEQVVGVLRDLGMTPTALTGMLKAIKASGKAGLLKAKAAVDVALPEILEMALKKGWSHDDIAWLESALTDYAQGYSFGKGHSVTYGVMAYRSAYMAVHHTEAFWCGVLVAYTGHKNAKKEDMERIYLTAAKKAGVKIFKPHVNTSEVDYTPVQGGIRAGLVSIPFVGRAAAAEIVAKAPYDSIAGFGKKVLASRVPGSKALAMGELPEEQGATTAVHALHAAGAFSGLPLTTEMKGS